MKFSVALIAGAIGGNLVAAAPWGEIETPANPLVARQGQFLAVTGVPGRGVYPRREIRQLATDADAFNLYILAMQRMQAVNQNDRSSYYQIANIHGNPARVSWDGVGPASGNSGLGYCTHSNSLFATWHRPYLCLMEQIMHATAVSIVAQVTDTTRRNNWNAALNRLRQPYWDWASSGGTIPSQISAGSITVTLPSGARSTIRNPLAYYGFNPRPSWHSTSTTARSGNANGNLGGSYRNTRANTYNILTQQQTFDQFSNHGSGQTAIGNLESIHDSIHVNVGGDMNFIGRSSFDPIFFLHHTNVDRIMSLWKILYPSTYVPTVRAQSSTYTIRQGTTISSTSALTPFHRDTAGNFHTSEGMRYTTNWGYNYPEYTDNPSAATLRQRINQLYGSGSSSFQKRADNGTQAPHVYQISVKAPMGLGTVGISAFLGKPTSSDTDAASWQTDKNFIGTIGLLSKSNSFKMLAASGVIPITEFLTARLASGDLKDNSEESVVDYIKNNFFFRITVDGVVVDVKTLAATPLVMTLYSAEVIPASGPTEFPKWTEFKAHDGILGSILPL